MDQTKQYDAHLAGYRRFSHIRSIEDYHRLYHDSLANPEGFWEKYAELYLHWDRKWDAVVRYDFDEAQFEWFPGAKLNAAFNCLDRHLAEKGEHVAFFIEGDRPGQHQSITYKWLHERVNRFSAVLRSNGVKKGDRVLIYLPMVEELPIAMLACARIGAVHVVIDTKFSANVLSNCIADCRPMVIVTSDGAFFNGQKLPIKDQVDRALEKHPRVHRVIVGKHTQTQINWTAERDVWWHDAEAGLDSVVVPPEPMDAEDPLFIFYYTGFSCTPRGLVHTHGGYLLHVAMSMHLVFDLQPQDIFWNSMPVSRIVGHSYTVYGTLLNGITGVLYEGAMDYPDHGRIYDIIEKYRVNRFYTTPTVIRNLSARGQDPMKTHDLSSLVLLATGGQPIDHSTWLWYYQVMGGQRCPVVNTYLQSETGGIVMASFPGVAPLTPGMCAYPFFGIDPVILDDSGEQTQFPGQQGVLCIRQPWPGMARTVFGDHEDYLNTYFSRIYGMYFTGDAAQKDDQGLYQIIGRVDDVMNVAGFRIAAVEFETVLIRHPEVAEVAVVGYPHPIKGQGVYAFITPTCHIIDKDDLSQQLVAWVQEHIGSAVELDVIQWVDGLPKTRSGKILRHILDKIASANFDDIGDTSAIAHPEIIDNLINGRRCILNQSVT